jgi:hypothetical protein
MVFKKVRRRQPNGFTPVPIDQDSNNHGDDGDANYPDEIEQLQLRIEELELENSWLSKKLNGENGVLKQKKIVSPGSCLTADEVERFGLHYVFFDDKRQGRAGATLNKDRFRSNYGVGPGAVAALILMLTERGHTINLVYMMMTLCHLNHYLSEHAMSGPWGIGEKCFREKVKEYTKMIQSLKPDLIKFEGWGSDEIHLISVDGCNFRTQEFRLDPHSKWYDHKSHSSGVSYEFALAIRRNKLVWMRGPFPAGAQHDITTFRGGRKEDGIDNWDKDALYHHMPPGTKAVGDSGYSGHPEKVTTSSKVHSEDFSQFITRAKNRQENFHSRLKRFDVLTKRFRHGISTEDKLEQHKMCTEAVCVLVQLDMDNGHPLWEV